MKSHFILFLAYFFVASPVLAVPQVQTLDSANSKIKFKLVTPMIGLAGKFQDFKGKMALDPHDFTRSQIVLEVGMKNLTVKTTGQNQIIPLGPLLEKLKTETALFESEKIRKLSDGSYEITGLVSRANKRWRMAVKAKPTKLSRAHSEFKVEVIGGLEAGSLPIPVPGTGGIEAKLVFKAIQPNL